MKLSHAAAFSRSEGHAYFTAGRQSLPFPMSRGAKNISFGDISVAILCLKLASMQQGDQDYPGAVCTPWIKPGPAGGA